MKPVIEKILSTIAPYQTIITVAIFICIAGIAIIILKNIYTKAKNAMSDVEKYKKENLKNKNMLKVPRKDKGLVIRTAIAADGIDPNPLPYMTILDGNREKYVINLTVIGLPPNVKFASTFAPLFNFEGCTSSVFIKPIGDEEMSRAASRQITILEAEAIRARGDSNRSRRLNNQLREIKETANEAESGENKFFDVAILFSLYADSHEELIKLSDAFVKEAEARSIIVTGCYAMQAEAYALNGPFNAHQLQRKVKNPPINYMIMDKYCVSTLTNFFQSSFSHKSGVPIGRDIITHNPIIYDLFEPTLHDSFSLAIAGKPGSGKSLLIKVLAARGSLRGWHFVAIDSQVKKGTSEGEYSAVAIACGGENFRLMNGSDVKLNLFDIGETIRSEKISGDTFKEVRTVDLSGKIATLTNNLCSIILSSASGRFNTVDDQTYVKRILIDTIQQTYNDFGIEDDNVDSLYIESNDGASTTGYIRKKLPTLTDFYMRILRNARNNNETVLEKAYTLIAFALKDYVTELYYTKESIRFLTRKAYESLPSDESGTKIFVNESGKIEEVIAVRGVRNYFDGQSTVVVNRDCPFANFDISMMPDTDRQLARQVCMSWITENFIKKNSEKLDASNKLVVILDEVHECYKDEFARNTVDITVREARKRYVGIILATQTLSEYENYPETRAILKLIESKFIFKQDYQDREYLIESLGITESQADMIVGYIGGSDREENMKNHKGEMCIIDGKKVAFCKVDYLPRTEEIIADTNAATVAKRMNISA